MRTSTMVSAMLCVVAVSAGAQTKVSGKLICGKPDVNASAEIPDVAGHVVALTKANCTWPAALEIAGAKTISAVDVSVSEMHGASANGHGYTVSTMDNGDKVNVSYQGTVQMNKDGSATFKGTWKWISGTGKFKGIAGSGTYKGSQPADGVGVAEIEGEYTITPGAKRAGKKP
jgi:hypothetical protein